MSEELLTADDLAVIFATKRRRVIEWAHQYQWPTVRIGNTIRWTPEQVEEIKRKHSVTPDAVKPPVSDGRTKASLSKKKPS
jgi:hypothetical protein